MAEEARTGKRFPLNLPIKLKTGETATTRDLSAAGVYIQADSELEVGTPIEFNISLPAEVVGTEEDVEIHCKGRVIRMDGGEGKKSKNGVACVIDQYEFLRKGK